MNGFNVYYAVASGDYQLVVNAPTETNPTILSHSQTGLVSGQTYKFKVSAVNMIGEGLTTDFIYVIAASMPEAPVNPPTVLEYDQTSITISLTPIASGPDGGSPITGYIVMIDDGLGGPFVQVQNSLILQLTISNLRSGRSYRIKYAGRNLVYD